MTDDRSADRGGLSVPYRRGPIGLGGSKVFPVLAGEFYFVLKDAEMPTEFFQRRDLIVQLEFDRAALSSDRLRNLRHAARGIFREIVGIEEHHTIGVPLSVMAHITEAYPCQFGNHHIGSDFSAF